MTVAQMRSEFDRVARNVIHQNIETQTIHQTGNVFLFAIRDRSTASYVVHAMECVEPINIPAIVDLMKRIMES
jgi:hypothetical protein